jgi:simple sugar transport system ATP-binding protein
MEVFMEKAIEMIGITKRFGTKVVANSDVNLTIYKGEILSLLGENGSGKTTLMNMLSGLYFPDEGEIRVNGEKVSINSPEDAYRLGIGMVHQHFKLVDVFTASENIILGLPGKVLIHKDAVDQKVKEISEKYGFEIDPKKKVYQMSVSEKQTVEIVKMLYRGVDTLILDEPTAVLTPQETDRLFVVLRKMKEDGKSVIIITHKLNEVLAISDRVAILRAGKMVDMIETKKATEEILTDAMVGTHTALEIERTLPLNKPAILDVQHLSCTAEDGVRCLKDVSFQVKGGEILGIAGVSGSGQKVLLDSITGLQNCDKGSKILYTDSEGKIQDLVQKTPKQIKRLGVRLAYVPEDRLGMGLVGDFGMTGNMMLRSYEEGNTFLLETKRPHDTAVNVKKELNVLTPSLDTPVRNLSGGNVQKVLVGRELSSHPRLFLTAYATRGLDINTSYAIYNLLNEEKKSGVGVVYVGEDLDVLLALTDRILVLCDGVITGIVDSRTADKRTIGRLMAGEKLATEQASQKEGK